MYIHLRDKSKPLPTVEECMAKFRRIRKPKETKKNERKTSKKKDRPKDST